MAVGALQAMMLARVMRLPRVDILMLRLMVLRAVMVLILSPDVTACWARVIVLLGPWVMIIGINASVVTVM